MSCILVSCVHRHCVFTIPEELRFFFLNDHSLLQCLFHAVRDVILRMFAKLNKSENFTPWRPNKHFDFRFLRFAFRKVLLEKISRKLGPSFHKLKNQIYKDHPDGFYVRAKPNPCSPDVTIKYISRYLGRPVIATSRIISYDGDSVTFHYTRYEDHQTVTECIPAIDFIKRLIIHIPDKHFKMVRYYGIYAKHHTQENNLRKCLSVQKKCFLSSCLDWRNSIILTFGYDPLKCPKCGTSMLVLEVYHKKTALFEQYQKVMGYG